MHRTDKQLAEEARHGITIDNGYVAASISNLIGVAASAIRDGELSDEYVKKIAADICCASEHLENLIDGLVDRLEISTR